MINSLIVDFNLFLQLIILFLHSFLLPTALIADKVLRELKDVSWEILTNEKMLSDGWTIHHGVLSLPASQRCKIESEYSTEDQQKKAAVQFWLSFDPSASWRRLIRQLDDFEEHVVAKQIHCYAEKLTGMTYTLQIRGCPFSVHGGCPVCTTLSGSPLTLHYTITC